jgi:iron complex outermembrane receptor protein
MKKFGITSCAAALGLGLVFAGASAFAQQSPQSPPPTPSQPEAKDQQLEKIEITGSFIPRQDVETPSNVQIISNDDLRRSGATSIADVLNSITANNQGTLSQGFSGAFAEGACGIALRGMTVGSTLVLLDGHRMAPYPLADDGQRSFVDICSLPLDVVDHVDVLKDGASALYGSDAIAGVVNVVLKKTFQGATISAENGVAAHGGAATSHLTGMAGWGDLGTDKMNAFLSIEYRHQDPLLLTQRPYLDQLNKSSQGGQDLRPGANNLASPLGTTTPVSNTGYFVNPNVTVPSGANPFNYYGYLPGCTGAQQTNNQCLVNPNWVDIVPATQNLNVLGRITRDIAEGWRTSLTASLFQSQVMIPGQPYFVNGASGGYSNAGFAPGPNGTVISTINTVPTFTAPVLASYHLNPTNFPVGSQQPINVYTGDLGGQDTHVLNQTYRVTWDIKGSAWGFDFDADYGWTADYMQIEETGFPIFGILQTDLANGSYVPGQINSSSVTSQIAPAQYSENKDSLTFAGAHASRGIVALPGGDLGIAAGVDWFYRALTAVPSALSTTAQQATNFAFAEGTQSDYSAYVELDAPVLKQLEFDGAVRYDHYNTYGSSTTPKIGFKLTPIQQIMFRGTYSEGFRAPNPVESASSGAGGYFGNFADPVLCPTGNKNSPNTYPNQCAIPEVFLTVSNPDLKPEKSNSKTLGLLLEPIQGHTQQVDWYDITLNNQIYPASEDLAFSPIAVRGAPQTQPYVNSSGVLTSATPAVGDFLYYEVPYININETQTKGFEFEFTDRFKLGEYGKLKSDFQITHMLHYYFYQPGITPAKLDLAGTHGPNEISGDTGTPRNRARWLWTWEQGPYEVQLAANYISGYNVLDPSAISGSYPGGQITCGDALNDAFNFPGGPFFYGPYPQGACHVASFTTFDIYGSWNMTKNWTFHASVDNFLDRKAPADEQTYAAPNYNPSLHMAGAVGPFITIGARYTF